MTGDCHLFSYVPTYHVTSRTCGRFRLLVILTWPASHALKINSMMKPAPVFGKQAKSKTYHFGIVVGKVAFDTVGGIWTPGNQPQLSIRVEVDAGDQRRAESDGNVLQDLRLEFGACRWAAVRLGTRRGAGSGIWQEIGRHGAPS